MGVEFVKMNFMEIICKILYQTSKLLHKRRKIFTQITLAFILPLSLSVFAHSTLPNILNSKNTKKTTPNLLQLSLLMPLIFQTLFSLLCTSTVVYTVACIRESRDISFKHVISVLSKTFKRLLLTLLCILTAGLAFSFVAFFIIFLAVFIALLLFGANESIIMDNNTNSSFIVVFITIFYFGALLYFMVIWEMSDVVSVLEESSCGFNAIAKSKAMLEGKMGVVAVALYLSLTLSYQVIQFVLWDYMAIIVPSGPLGVIGRIVVVIIWFLSFCLKYLIRLMVDTELYFVCKSYHQEKVDMLALPNHLQGSLLADYVP